MDYQLTRAALGRVASVGDLYDIRTDNFCGLSIFKKSLPPGALSLVDAHSSDIRMIHNDSFTEKFTKFDVSPELSVSLLAGLVKVEGSGRYLGDQKKTARTVKSSLLYKIQTKVEKVNIYHEDLQEAYSIDAIKSACPTHVVTEICWGANSVISCVFEKWSDKDVKRIEGSLSAQMTQLSESISGKESASHTQSEIDDDIQFEVRIFGDILAKNGDLPTTMQGALQLMKNLPSLLAECNEGKGTPLIYKLLPIHLFKSYLKFGNDKEEELSHNRLKNTSLIRVVQIFDQMSDAQQRLNDLSEDISEYKCCVRSEDRIKISNMKNDMSVEEANLRTKLSTFLKEVRSGTKSESELESLIQEFQTSSMSPQNVNTTLEEWIPLQKKLSFARILIENGVTYIGVDSTLDAEMFKTFDSKSYVLYFSSKSKSEDSSRWIANRQIFFKEISKRSVCCTFYAVDCDFHPELLPSGRSSFVQLYQDEKCVVEDLLNRQMKKLSISPSPKWVAASRGVIPEGALKGGRDNWRDIYVARAEHEGGIIPGKLVAKFETCHLPWGGGEHVKNEYEVLVFPEDRVSWIATCGNTVIPNAIPGGFSESGEVLYIGRTKHADTITIGKVQLSNSSCFISYGGLEYCYKDYEILVKKKKMFPFRNCTLL